ncbi:MAG: hypothetical protein ACJA1C_000982 [Crocinitomicaceae bacterium]|jgi:hypothetical protein
MKRAIPFEMRGRYCEFDNQNKKRFLEVHVCEYNPKDIEYLKGIDCFEASDIYSFIALISDEIPDNTYYLYRLDSYFADSKIEDGWEFSQSITDYRQNGFYSIDKLLEFCLLTWKIMKNDFKPLSEKSIPF